MSIQTRATSTRRLAYGSLLLALITLATGGQSDKTKAARSFERGKHYLEQQQFSEADIEFRKSIRLNPQPWEPGYYLATTELKLGLWEDAHKNLADVVGRNPEFVPARLD